MKKLVPVVFFITCLAFASQGLSVSKTETEQAEVPQTTDAVQPLENSVFHGIVKKTGDGMALFTKNEVYPLVGGDFSMIVDKEVDIIGKVVKEGDVEKIAVARIQMEKK